MSNVDVISNHLQQNRWKESAEKFLVSLAFVLAYFFAVMGSQALVFEVFSSASFYASAQAVTFLIANAVMFGLFSYHRSKTRDQWIKDEAQKFLSARSSQNDALPSTWRKKLRRGMVWGPTIFALGVFLFFPEILGIASHLPGQPIGELLLLDLSGRILGNLQFQSAIGRPQRGDLYNGQHRVGFFGH